MNVGQGDGTVLITPLGQVVLIDDGAFGNTAAPVAQLQALGVTQVDLHFASHYHADHIGAYKPIVDAGINVLAGWDRGGSYGTATYTNYINTLTPARRHTLVKNQVFTLDAASAHPVTIKCIDLKGAGISPVPTDENSLSLVLRVSYGEYDEVFGGDLTGDNANSDDVESIVGPAVGPVEVYKVHHHGSRYSSNNNFLTAIQAKIGVIQCGDGNSYGHPTTDALNRLHAKGVRTFWTQLGSGATPNPTWDRVANGQVIIQATWEPGGIDTVRVPGYAETFTNSGAPVDVTAPVVQLLSPNGGEVLAAATTANVTWSASDNFGVTSVDLDYSLNFGGSWTPLAVGEANDGACTWLVPNVVTNQALVRVTARDLAGNAGAALSAQEFSIYRPSAVADGPGGGARPRLLQNYPNPFNPVTTIGFLLPEAAEARVILFSADGRLVRTLLEGFHPAGYTEVIWDGSSDAGTRVPSGVYFYRLESGPTAETRRLVLSR